VTSPLGRLLGVTGDRAAQQSGNARPPKGGSSNVWYSTPGQPQVPEWDGLTALRSGYQASVYIMQPVRLIATALGSLPFRVGADPGKAADYDLAAPMAKLLGPPPGGPNPATSSRNLWIWSLVQRLVAGRMAWETVCPPGSNTPPAALWPLVSAFLNPIPSGPGSVRWFDGFQYQIPSGRIDYRAEQVFYSWRPSQIDWRQPESALQAANMPASLQIALNQYMWALAKNGMTAKKMVITPSFAEDDERRAWEEQFAAEFTGYVNGGRTLHGYYDDDSEDFGGGNANRTPPIQVVDLATSPTDGQVLQILKAVQDDMLRTWRVPMSWLGDSSARTYENASQEAKNFWQGPVMELAAEVCDDVNHMLAPRFGDGNVGWFDFSGVEALRGGSIFGQVAPDAALKAGLIKPDDWRNDVGLPPIDPADAGLEKLPAIEDTPGGTSMTNFSRRSTAVEFKPGRVDAADVRSLLENAYPGSVLGWIADATWKYDPAVPLDEIKMARRPGGRDFDKVQGIAQAVKDGKAMDPVVLIDTGESKLEIADGYHRTLGFDRAGRRTIAALVGSGVGVHGPWEKDMHDAKLNRAASLRYDTAPLGTGKNWVTETGGLDPFLRAIAHALIRDGHTESEAIQLAVGVAKRWASGGGKVTAKTRAKATRAVARWEAQKVAAHETPSSRDALTETSSAGALLPKGVPAEEARKIRRHMYTPGEVNRRRCAECDGPVTAPAHGLVGQRSPISLDGLRRKTSRAVNGHADDLEPQMADVMRTMFAKQQAATLSRLGGRRGQQMIRAAQPPDDGQPQQVTPTEPNVNNIFDFAHWVEATRTAVQPVYAAVQIRTVQQLASALHPGEPVFGAAVDAAKAVMDGRASALADTVTRTTYDEIAAALREGLANGEGIPALAKRVRDVFEQANQSRAETIARTEVMSAINASQDTYAKHLPAGTVAEKQWLATPDSRTRETHREADGQRKPLGEPFSVGGFPMQHPGDHTAPPDEWINCRCTTLYIPASMSVPAAPAAAIAA
jgi:SPP1 gp7 family putative phage head morphogenesis protein